MVNKETEKNNVCCFDTAVPTVFNNRFVVVLILETFRIETWFEAVIKQAMVYLFIYQTY